MKLSVIIPTIDGREEWVRECLASYKEHSPADTEFIVIENEPSCGQAWIKGFHRSSGELVHFTADDITPFPGWWVEASYILSARQVPAANVVDKHGAPNGCLSPLGALGNEPNILVPMLNRDWIEVDEMWLPPFHYGSDDWVTYYAKLTEKRIVYCESYKFMHHVASSGRDYTRRPSDVRELVDAMDKAGYVPPVYRELDHRLQLSETGLDSVRLNELNTRRGRTPPTIYTASQFKNEVDVLEIRLETIGHMVDKIVLAEASVDQRGRPKELNFPQHKNRFKKWLHKLEYVIVDDMPQGHGHEWDFARERWQRNALIRGMPNLQPHDLVYVSDLDEIPTPDALAEAILFPPMRFGMDLHVYALNWRWLDRGCRIGTLGAVVFGEDILNNGVCWAVLHDQRVKQRPGVSGWHLTYQGGVEYIRDKITGMMDKHELLVMPGMDPDIVLTDEWIQESIATGRDIFGRIYRPSEWVGPDEMPPPVKANPSRYAHMMVPRPENQDEIESQPRCTCGGIFDSERNLRHFAHCELGDSSSVEADDRTRPRSLDV